MTNRKPVPGCLLCEESICDECGPQAAVDSAVPGSARSLLVYYDSLDGLGLLRLNVEDRDSVYDSFHAEAKHRGICVPSYLGHEPVEDARQARASYTTRKAFISGRITHLLNRDKTVAVDPAVPGSEQTVIATVQDEFIYRIDPSDTPFMKARRGGVTQWQADLQRAMTSWGERAAMPGHQPQGDGWVSVYDQMAQYSLAGQMPSGDEEGWVDMGEEGGPAKAVAIEPAKNILPPEVHIEDKSIDVERAWRATRDLCRG